MEFKSRDVLKRLEARGGKCVLKAYPDGAGVWTIAWGHTRNVHAGMTCTEEQGEAWLDDDLRGVFLDIERLIHVPLTQGEYDALVIWHFNCDGLTKTPTVAKLINAGKMAEAGAQMAKWKYITDPRTKKKVISRGLVQRRAMEQVIWNQSNPRADDPPPTGNVPEPPPATVQHTTTGKLSTGALLSGMGAGVTSMVGSVQPVVDAVKQAFGWADSLNGAGHWVVVGLVAVSLCCTLGVLWHQERNVQGAA